MEISLEEAFFESAVRKGVDAVDVRLVSVANNHLMNSDEFEFEQILINFSESQ